MITELQALRLASALAFFIAAAYGTRNYLLTKKISGLWLWLSIALGLIGASRLANTLIARNPLYHEAATGLLLAGAVMITMMLFDFEKEANLCVNCSSSISDTTQKDRKAKAEKMLKGF